MSWFGLGGGGDEKKSGDGAAAAAEEKFSMSKCRDGFRAAIDGETISVERFCVAMLELSKVFDLLGSGTGFIKSDITSKVAVLRALGGEVKGEKFESVADMVQLEVRHKMHLSGKSPPNGTRTLLRLRRVFEFLVAFLDRMKQMKPDDESLTNVASAAYGGTLSSYHPWAVQQLVNVALYALPYRVDFVESLDAECVVKSADGTRHVNAPKINAELDEFVEAMRPHLKVLTDYYTKHELNEVP